jgi:hypothetical protein
MMNENTINAKQDNVNCAIQTIVATLGVIFGIGGVGHGFFETLQGNTATISGCAHDIDKGGVING